MGARARNEWKGVLSRERTARSHTHHHSLQEIQENHAQIDHI